MLERTSKVFGCFLDVREAFDAVWIDGLLYKLFSEFDIRGRMWLVIKDLYIKSGVKYCTPAHCPENLTFHKELVRREYKPRSCINFILTIY